VSERTEYAAPPEEVEDCRTRPCLGNGDIWEEPDRWERRSDDGRYVMAVAIQACERCPVLAPCRAWALTDPDPSKGMVAGGMTTLGRRVERRRLSAESAA
jgi:hypothetical protein